MTPYIAPLADMRFVLRELTDIDSLAKLPDSEALADADLTDAILEQAARFASEVLAPLDSIGDREGARWTERGVITSPGFAAAYREFVAAGWNNIEMPAQYGGQDLPAVLCCAVHEMFVAANKAFCMCPDLSSPAVKALAAAASDPLKSLYIPKLVSGEWAATMNLTEPQAGSDVGALRTRAEPRSDGSYRLFGQKIFISFGDHDFTDNIVHLVLARATGAPPGSRGVSLFVVPKFLPDGRRNDVQCTGIEHKLGNHASPTCTLVFGAQGEGAAGWLVGSENKGLQAMFVMMNGARFNVGLEGVGIAERAYQNALAYARERIQGRLASGGSEPVPIIRHPDVRRMLLTMRSQIEAMRAVAYVIAAARDIASRHPDPAVRSERQAFVDLMIPVFKGWASETAIEIASTSIQVHGGAGYIDDHGATQPLRDVRIAAIYEGTTSIQAHDLVERKLVRDGGAAFRSCLSQINATLHQLDAKQRTELTVIARKLRSSVMALQEATESALVNYGERPLEVLAGSVPLLCAFGLVTGGWQMARAALVAHRHLEEGRGNAVFLRGKLTSAVFYATNVLPRVVAAAETAMHGGESVMAMEEAAF
jgi:alkylation response protein AidB-like acyl-CoA dehydrogenase